MTLQEPAVAEPARARRPWCRRPAKKRTDPQGVVDRARRHGHPGRAPDLADGAAQGLAALLVPGAAAALPAHLPVRADPRERRRVPQVPAGRQHVRRRVGGPLLRPHVHQRPAVLARLHQHGDPRVPHAAGGVPAADHPGPDAQRGPVAPVQAEHPDHLLPAALHVRRDRRGHRVPADLRQRHGEPDHRGGRRVGDHVHAGAVLVPHDLPVVGGLADGRLGHDPLPRGPDDDRRPAVRGVPDRRRQPLAADVAHHPAGHPPDDDRAAHPQRRHVHGGAASRRSCCCPTR